MIHVIATSANLKLDYLVRKEQYLTGLKSVITYYGLNPYIIESCNRTDYLAEHYIGHTYSENKGVNEFVNIENFFKENSSKFADEDVVIKTTLRYEIISSELLDVIKEQDHDAYCKSSADIYGASDTGIHSFLFAMKYKCWKEFLTIFKRDVHRDDPIEVQLSAYVKTLDTKYLNKLGILANPSNHKKIYSV
jgi:hypothetical protein